jgi:hypothetical protein
LTSQSGLSQWTPLLLRPCGLPIPCRGQSGFARLGDEFLRPPLGVGLACRQEKWCTANARVVGCRSPRPDAGGAPKARARAVPTSPVGAVRAFSVRCFTRCGPLVARAALRHQRGVLGRGERSIRSALRAGGRPAPIATPSRVLRFCRAACRWFLSPRRSARPSGDRSSSPRP